MCQSNFIVVGLQNNSELQSVIIIYDHSKALWKNDKGGASYCFLFKFKPLVRPDSNVKHEHVDILLSLYQNRKLSDNAMRHVYSDSPTRRPVAVVLPEQVSILRAMHENYSAQKL